MSKKERIKRYILLVAGLFVQAAGIALTRRGDLGVSPISSVTNVMSEKFDTLSFGTWVIIWNFTLLTGQIAILRRDFRPMQLVQIPLSVIFGYFTDLGVWLTYFVPIKNYPERLFLAFSGTALLALGITLSVSADVVLNSGEAFVKAVSDKLKISFGNVKIMFDVFCVALAVVLSLLFFSGSIVGTREGTLVAALFTGVFVKLYTPRIRPPLEHLLKKRP